MAQTSKPTQDFVPLKEVRDGVAVLKDGGLRALLLASSLNFALKSADEQTATLLQFQNFLNSLDFSIQIFVQSRRLDIRPYIALLEERYKEQLTDLMKVQTREYIEFIRNFTENTNIMSKSFFLVIPYDPPTLTSSSLKGFGGVLGPKPDRDQVIEEHLAAFEENKTQLEQRVSVVEQGLTRTGVRVAQLGTEEIIELFYKLFNPGELEKPVQLNSRV